MAPAGTSFPMTSSDLPERRWPKRSESSLADVSIALSVTTILTKPGVRISSGAWRRSSDRLFKMGDQGNEYVIFDHPADEPMGNGDVNGSIKMLHPRTKVELKPTLLDGTVVSATARENPRKALADWMVRHPYFAEAAVNRIWSYFFGRGIVDPVDDFRSTNPATHPELLARLAQDFRDHNHDLRYLIRTIVSSRTYQLSGVPNETNADDRSNYSHAVPRAVGRGGAAGRNLGRHRRSRGVFHERV